MAKQKFTIKCVNNGKPFEMPDWTTEKHEAALAKLAKAQKENKWDNDTAESEFKYYVIYETMLEIDPACDFDELKKFCKHPVTLLQLFNEVYNAGKENIYYQDFRHKKQTQKQKK